MSSGSRRAPSTDAKAASQEVPRRIVSLVPSATEIACVLGLADRLVGISHECDYPEGIADRPCVTHPRLSPGGSADREVDRAVREAAARHGQLYRLDRERLRELAPDLILTGGAGSLCAVSAREVAECVEAAGLDARVLKLGARYLLDIPRVIVRVGRAAGVEERARETARSFEAKVGGVRNRVEGAGRPRVLSLVWVDPPYVAGRWVPGMIKAAGGRDVMGKAGVRSRRLEPEDLRALDADRLLLMPGGCHLEEAQMYADRARLNLWEVAPRALGRDSAWVLDASSYFNRPGPRTADGVELLARVLHPERAGGVPPGDAARRWRPRDAEDGGGDAVRAQKSEGPGEER